MNISQYKVVLAPFLHEPTLAVTTHLRVSLIHLVVYYALFISCLFSPFCTALFCLFSSFASLPFGLAITTRRQVIAQITALTSSSVIIRLPTWSYSTSIATATVVMVRNCRFSSCRRYQEYPRCLCLTNAHQCH